MELWIDGTVDWQISRLRRRGHMAALWQRPSARLRFAFSGQLLLPAPFVEGHGVNVVGEGSGERETIMIFMIRGVLQSHDR